MVNQEKANKHRDSFIRWQQLTLGQLSYTNNLILTFCVAVLGFFQSNIKFTFCLECPILLLTTAAYLLLFSSFLFGILLTLNRLKDFRATKDIARLKQQKYENENNATDELLKLNAKIAVLEEKASSFGKLTWTYLWIQVWTFFLGTIFSMLAIALRQ